MSVFSRLGSALKGSYDAVFRQHLNVQVQQGKVKVRLEERNSEGRPVPRAPTPEELAARKQADEVRLMQFQLAELLDQLPETRHTLRHLVFVEQAFERKGLKALDQVPVDVLRKALEQFEGLVMNWSPVGLALLRSRMAVALLRRDNGVAPAPATNALAEDDPTMADTVPLSTFAEGVDVKSSDDDALAAAYAALGTLAPSSAAPASTETTPARVHTLGA